MHQKWHFWEFWCIGRVATSVGLCEIVGNLGILVDKSEVILSCVNVVKITTFWFGGMWQKAGGGILGMR